LPSFTSAKVVIAFRRALSMYSERVQVMSHRAGCGLRYGAYGAPSINAVLGS
jgi:hypothetical protein